MRLWLRWGRAASELQGMIGFLAWLAVHAVLLTSFQAKIEAFVAWAWTYIGGARGDALLDRPEELRIDWTDEKNQGSGGVG